MGMQERWRRLIESLSLLQVLLRAHRQTTAVVGTADEEDTEAACDACCERVEEVLLTTEEAFKLERAVENARNYYLDGITGAAIVE